MAVMADIEEHVDLERLGAALAAVEPDATVRRSFARMRTGDLAPSSPPCDVETPTRRYR
jgi:hypothetical protein